MQDMNFALKKVRYWRYIEKMAIISPFFISKKDNSKDQIKKIVACKKKICKF